MNKFLKNPLFILGGAAAGLVLFALAFGYVGVIKESNTLEREKMMNERREIVVQRKERCLILKKEYLKDNEADAALATNAVIYSEKDSTCYLLYSVFQYNYKSKEDEINQVIVDLYSEDIIADTAPNCAGAWCMTLDDFNMKKKMLGFAE